MRPLRNDSVRPHILTRTANITAFERNRAISFDETDIQADQFDEAISCKVMRMALYLP